MFFSAGVQPTAARDAAASWFPKPTASSPALACPFSTKARSTTRRHSPATAACSAWSPSSTWPATAFTTSRAGFAAGRRESSARIEIGAQQVPIGDLLFDCGGVRIGFEICRDAWVADRTGARLAQRGADILLNPSASHFAFAKQQIRERFVLEGSRAFCVSYAYANLLGNEAGRAIYDGGTLIAIGRQDARPRRHDFPSPIGC